MTGELNKDALKMAMARATTWFQIHADQRIRLMNFYVVLLAAVIAGLGAALKDDNRALDLLIAVVMAVVTYAFQSLDRRSASLVKDAEAALGTIEAAIASETRIEDIELVKKADSKAGTLSYRRSFNLLFYLGYALAGTGVVLWIWPFIDGLA